jgi:hypothetical protein
MTSVVGTEALGGEKSERTAGRQAIGRIIIDGC